MTDRAVQPEAPTTKAGRVLLEQEAYNSRSFPLITVEAIVAIEAEARAASQERPRPDLSAVKDAVEALVLSFRRYCIWRWNVAPDVEDFRQMLADAEDIHFNGDTDEGRSFRDALSASQERPQPDYEQINGVTYERRADGRLHLPGVAQERPSIDVDSLGLSDEQTRNLRQHLADRQQTLGEWIGDVLFDFRLGRPDGIDYPPAGGSVASPEPSDD
jgi:hypothetical protein